MMPSIFFKVITLIKRYLQRLLRIKTLGVRIMIMNENRQVLLIRHTYAPGWHFPGGGVDHRETMVAAAQREAYEEAGIVCQQEPKLLGIFYHTVRGADDHVALFLVESFTQKEVHSPEIAECVWFAIDNLPEDTTVSTRQRLVEYLSASKLSDQW